MTTVHVTNVPVESTDTLSILKSVHKCVKTPIKTPIFNLFSKDHELNNLDQGSH